AGNQGVAIGGGHNQAAPVVTASFAGSLPDLRTTQGPAKWAGIMQTLQSAFGVVGLLAIAWAISENRWAVPWRHVAAGVAVSFVLAIILLKVPQVGAGFAVINNAVDAVAAATRAGTSFVFGYLGGGPLPFEPKTPGSDFILALQALP